MNLTIGNSTTVTTSTGVRLNVVTLAGPPGPPGVGGTGAAGAAGVSSLNGQTGALTGFATSGSLAGYVPVARTVNTFPLTGNLTITATQIPVAIAPNAGFSNLQQFINTMHSPGLIVGATITDAGSGNAHISAGTGMLRVADDNISSLLFVSIPQTTVAVPQDLVQRYVGFVYNSGAPMFDVRLVNNWDNDTEIPLGTVTNFFGTLIVSNNPFLVGDPITNIIQRFDAMAPITRDQLVGGLNLGEIFPRHIILSAGKLWTRLNDYAVPAIDMALGVNTYSAYFNGLYWAYTTAITQWDNTSYNDITVGLVPVSIGYYTNLWFYLTVETNALGYFYDQHQYGDLTSASLASAPSFLPDNFTNGSILLGRLLFHQGATVADQIDSAFIATFSSSPVTAHNQLAGLQGGFGTTEYYHLSQSDYNVLTGRAGTTIVNSINGISGAANLTGAQGISVLRNGQTITVSGQDWATNAALTATGATLIARDNGISGVLAASTAQSGASLYSLVTSLSGQASGTYATAANLTATGVTLGASNALLSGLIAQTGSSLFTQLTGASGQLSTNLTATGVALGASDALLSGALAQTGAILGARDTLISGITTTGLTNTGAALYALITQASGAANQSYSTISQYTGLSGALGVTGSTLDTKVNSLSGFTVAASGALNALIVGGGGTQVKVTGSATLAIANLTGAGGVTVSLSGSQILISGAGTVNQAQLDSLSGYTNTALSATGTALINRDFLISGILSSGLAVSGSGLYALITGLSGQAVSSYATLGNLALTGQSLNALITGLSGQASGTYATIANLALTGSGLYRTMTGMSGALVSLIGASAAGVASLNGASGVVNIQGAAAGNITVTAAGQTITVSGSTGDYALFAQKTDLGATGTALLARDLQTSGVLSTGLAQTGSSLYGLIVGLSGQGISTYATTANLALTGSGLYALVTGLSGQAVAAYATQTNVTLTGVQLGATIALTGSGLYALVTGMSGAANVSLALTGQQAWTAANTNAVVISGNLTATGATLYGLTVGLSGQASATYATLTNVTLTGTQLGATTALTGSNLYALITSSSGAANAAIAATGQAAWVSANGAANTLSGNLTATGVTLNALIIGLSGQDIANYATKTSLTATGALLSAIQVTGSAIIPVANFTGLGGTLVIYSGNTIFVSGAAGSAGGGSNVQVTGSAVLTTVNLTGINGLGVIYSGNQVFISGNGNTTAQVTGSTSLTNVNLTGFGTTVVTYDGVFVRISGAPAGTGAGVTSLNGVAAVVNLVGTGGLQVTNVGATIYVSGLTTTTGSQLVFMNRAGVLSGDSSLLWDETNDILAVAKTRLHMSGISIAPGDRLTLGTGIIVSESGLTYQSPSLAGGATLSLTGIAGYGIASVMTSGLGRAQSLLGPAMWSKQFTAVVPQTTTAVTVYGNTSAAVGTLSTVSTEVLGQYTNYASAATPFVAAGSAVTTPYYFRGSVTGRNGFFFSSTFSLADGNNTTGAYGSISGSRLFIGMTDQAALASVIMNNPAGNRVGLSYIAASGGTQPDRYDLNWQIEAKDNVTVFTGVTPMTFLTGFYRFSMYAPPFATNNTGVYWQLDDLIRGSGAAGIITGNLPIGSTQMRPQAMVCAVSGGARNMRVNSLYVESAV